MAYFYSKYIVIESLIEELHSMDLSDEERAHLSILVDSSLHHAILDEILSNLSKEDKRLFLQQFTEDPHDEKLMEFLNKRIDNVEEKIKKVADELVTEMHKDTKESKRLASRK